MSKESEKEKSPIEESEQKFLKECEESSHKMAFKPAPGLTWNPLRTLDPNRKCPCQSGIKFKKCCLDKLAPVVTVKEAENYRLQMSKPDLVFLNDKNEEKIKHMVAPQILEEIKRRKNLLPN
jgi:hypothetical protein